MPSTDPDCIKSKSYDDICSKSHHDISDGVGIQQFLSDNTKGLIDNYDIGRVGDEVIWTEEMLLTDPDCTKSKSHGNNGDNNRDSNRVGDKQQGADDLEDPEQFCNINYKQKVFDHI